MIFSALLSFFGGAAFRYGLGRLIDWLEKRQDHLQELDRLREQEKIDAAKHVRQKELIELQANLKVQEIKLVGETQVDLEAARAFTEAMKVANTPTGIAAIDAWNGSIRPASATIALTIWISKIVKAGFAVTQWDTDLMSGILGFYFADRHMGKKKA